MLFDEGNKDVIGEVKLVDELNVIDKEYLTELIQSGSYIALNSSPHFEQFYIYECCVAFRRCRG